MLNEEQTIRLIRMEEKLDSFLEKINSHEKEIYGNGQPGLKQDVQMLKTQNEMHYVSCPNTKQIAVIQDTVKDFKETKKFAIGALCTSVLTLISGLVAGLWYFLV